MRYRLSGIRTGLDDPDTHDLRKLIARHTGLDPESIESAELSRRSIDARKKDRIRLVLSIDFTLTDGRPPGPETGVRPVHTPPDEDIPFLDSPPPLRPVVVGMGPAGLFAALMLARHGAPPLVIDRGAPIEERTLHVSAFWKGGDLDAESNVQFGEGGAGAFSDGKLTTRIDDHRVEAVLKTLVMHGAPEDIMYEAKPHVGTDLLRKVVRSIRDKLLEMGADIRFHSRLDGIRTEDGAVRSLEIAGERVEAALVVLAPGNAARDTYSLLVRSGAELKPKPFAVGVRVEHPRTFIDKAQYGSYAGHPALGSADYVLTYQDRDAKRAAYTFCMCPGGYVVNASSEPGGVVVNGMSYRNRRARMSNSAVVVTVTPGDFAEGPLGGVEYQRAIEAAAFKAGGGSHAAPAQDMKSFLSGTAPGDVSGATVRPGPIPAILSDCIPPYVYEILRGAIRHFDTRLKGFVHPEAVLTGFETRTSSPVRITRMDDMQSAAIRGIYPCGEGSGYAGGIVSSAVDGIKAAEAVIKRLAGRLPV